MKYNIFTPNVPKLSIGNPLMPDDVDCHLILGCINAQGVEFFTVDTCKRLVLAFEALMFFADAGHFEKCTSIKRAIYLYRMVYHSKDGKNDLIKTMYGQARKAGIIV